MKQQGLFTAEEIREACKRELIDSNRFFERLYFARHDIEYKANEEELDRLIKESSKNVGDGNTLRRFDKIDKLFARNEKLMRLMYPDQFKDESK